MKGHRPAFHALVSRGQKAGALFYPNKPEDDAYVVSMTRFERDYQRVFNLDGLLGSLEKGYPLGFSSPAAGVPTPSLIQPKAIYRPVRLD